MDPLAFSQLNAMTNAQPGVTQLDFNHSMQAFKTMFPMLEENLIETVLRSNQGAVDATIDQLLQISSETPSNNNAPTNPPSYTASVASDYNKNLNLNSTPKEKVHKSNLKELNSLSQAQPPQKQQQLIDFDTVDSQACAATKSRFNPPLVGPLPNDFLRITSTNQTKNSNQQYLPTLTRQSSKDHQVSHQLLKKKLEENEKQRQNSSSDNKEIAQYLEDERIAILLQNEEFVTELRRNKEFMSALNYDAMNHNTRVKGLDNENYTGSDADFKDRVRKMSELSRKKFNQLAGLFTRKAGMPSRDNLLGDRHGDQYAQLENDYSDSEENSKKVHNKF